MCGPGFGLFLGYPYKKMKCLRWSRLIKRKAMVAHPSFGHHSFDAKDAKKFAKTGSSVITRP
jgi:hypothetical protein